MNRIEYKQELEQEPFDGDEFVERLAWKLQTEYGLGQEVDPDVMNEGFLQAISDLEQIKSVAERKCEKLLAEGAEEEVKYKHSIHTLQENNNAAFNQFNDLDEKISLVATRVVHLGEQLESVNTPRARAVEARTLINYFTEFISTGPLIAVIFTDKDKLFEAADVIQKLHLIAQELPTEDFCVARDRIGTKYDEIERNLITEFVRAHRSHDPDFSRMKEIAAILANFKGYHQCVDAFIEQSQLGGFTTKDVFRDVLPLCEKCNKDIKQVFSSPHQVMSKFILNIYSSTLQEHVHSTLADKSDCGTYLKNLCDMYGKMQDLNVSLCRFDMGNDNSFLTRLTNNIFQRYLDTYINLETSYLKDKCGMLLNRYYNSKHHQKRQLPSGGIHDIKTMIGQKANINIGPAVENFGGETFLSEETALNILQESKLAFKRCQLLSRGGELALNAMQIFELLILYLVEEHMEYAVELGLWGVPLPDPKNQPIIYFFDIVQQANSIIHLFERQFTDCLLPLIISTSKHAECLQTKKQKLHNMEMKLEQGIDRSVQAIVGWVKVILQTEQKRTDFKPEQEEEAIAMATVACTRVVNFISNIVETIRDNLDGKNIEATFTELGIRVHRVIYEHLQGFTYTSVGAMSVICDVTEYRKCISELKIPLLNSLFDTLNALCNLLVVPAENIRQICSGDQLAQLDRSVLLNFMQLRADYKQTRLGNQFKGWTAL